MGEADLYVKAGSTVSLKCVITQALEEPAYIFWYHNDARVLNYDRSLVEIRMERVAPDTTVTIRFKSCQSAIQFLILWLSFNESQRKIQSALILTKISTFEQNLVILLK